MKKFCSVSEAMREGAKLTPEQCFGKLFGPNSTCAMGAVLHAILDRPLVHDDATIGRFLEVARANPEFVYLKKQATPPCGCSAPMGAFNPETGRRFRDCSLQNIMVHLNNEHRWSREAIADWLETEEEKLGYVTVCETEPLEAEFVTVEVSR